MISRPGWESGKVKTGKICAEIQIYSAFYRSILTGGLQICVKCITDYAKSLRLLSCIYLYSGYMCCSSPTHPSASEINKNRTIIISSSDEINYFSETEIYLLALFNKVYSSNTKRYCKVNMASKVRVVCSLYSPRHFLNQCLRQIIRLSLKCQIRFAV